jgi:transcriptional regulator with XRE-family HTH domain
VTIKRKTKGIADQIDKHVGQRLRVRRSLLGLSQEKLADAVGVTFQQIQKYERGTNRISASRLLAFSQALEIPVDYFYENMTSKTKGARKLAGFSDTGQEPLNAGKKNAALRSDDLMTRKETIEVVRLYYALPDQETRKSIIQFMKKMIKNNG